MTHVFQGQHVRHFLRLVIPPQTNNSSNISVFNRWVPVGACPKCSQIADISRSLADHDVSRSLDARCTHQYPGKSLSP